MPQGKWFRIGYAIIVVLLIAYLAMKVDYLFDPIGEILAALFVPIVLSGMFYYMFRPAVRLLATRLPLSLSIVIVYLAVLGLIVLFSWLIWPPIREQSMTLVQNFPDIVKSVSEWLTSIQKHQWVQNISNDETFSTENLSSQISAALGDILNSVVGSVRSLFNMVMNFFLLLGLVPFIIYYMLREGDKFPALVLRMIPDRLHNEALPAMKEIDASIGSFILSKVITSLIIGTLTFCGYFFIDLPYPLLLGLVAAVTNVIPYLGPLLAAIPTVIVALTISPITALQACAIIIISNQIESNIIGPKIMGKQLNVHPLTIMMLVIGAGAIIGPLGMVIVVPVYAIVKIIAIRIYNFNKNNRIHKEPDLLPPPPRI
ncbi:AI-2E family transporter [Cohnella lupini]|uniref:Putative PurR-regulated permease PerM n=1 Tax=Cohnella lupini TaxID=1294267 RepID=A0A3D9IJ89_9BACL|nr:AI-2E family transporter [Cohnella lupini]RED61717.1 putative PurR-regulated permease PerM [Cohnella lupini]